MRDFRPAIDRAAEMLNCLPGEVPEKLRGLVEGYPADEPPDNDRDVLILDDTGYGLWRGWCNSGHWRRYTDANQSVGTTVLRWWELPHQPGPDPCIHCGHSLADHRYDIGNGEMSECHCGCHQFAAMDFGDVFK